MREENLINKKKAIFLDRDGVINENVYYDDTQAWESQEAEMNLNSVQEPLMRLKIAEL